jgi:hypothetical protein
MIRQVDDIMQSAPSSKNRLAVLDDIATKVSFKISAGHRSRLYATHID